MVRILSIFFVILACSIANAERVSKTWDSGLNSNSTARIAIGSCAECTNHQFQFYTNGTSAGTFTLTGLNIVGGSSTEYVVSLPKNGGTYTTNSTTKTDFVLPSVNATHGYITTGWGVKYWGW